MDFKTKILVICVDRDNDIGEKASLNLLAISSLFGFSLSEKVLD